MMHDADKKELSTRADAIKDNQEAMEIIKECKSIIRTNKKKIIGFAYKQGKFSKNVRMIQILKILLKNLE